MTYDTSIHTNPDAQAWAKLFMQTREERPDTVIDEALMIGWFANAMMAMHDYLLGAVPINGDHAQHLLDLASGAAPKEFNLATQVQIALVKQASEEGL